MDLNSPIDQHLFFLARSCHQHKWSLAGLHSHNCIGTSISLTFSVAAQHQPLPSAQITWQRSSISSLHGIHIQSGQARRLARSIARVWPGPTSARHVAKRARAGPTRSSDSLQGSVCRTNETIHHIGSTTKHEARGTTSTGGDRSHPCHSYQ